MCSGREEFAGTTIRRIWRCAVWTDVGDGINLTNDRIKTVEQFSVLSLIVVVNIQKVQCVGDKKANPLEVSVSRYSVFDHSTHSLCNKGHEIEDDSQDVEHSV